MFKRLICALGLVTFPLTSEAQFHHRLALELHSVCVDPREKDWKETLQLDELSTGAATLNARGVGLLYLQAGEKEKLYRVFSARSQGKIGQDECARVSFDLLETSVGLAQGGGGGWSQEGAAGAGGTRPGGCPEGPPCSGGANRNPTYAVVRVFYATDRSPTGTPTPAAFYGADRGSLAYGKCDVSIPRDHRMGALEAPSVWRFEFRQDPEKHVVLLAVQAVGAKGDYYRDLKASVSKSTDDSAFLFIHGYNVTFEDAARRTAQMAYDLGFSGAPIFFSWPAKGETSAYERDETNVEWATPHLAQFLQELLGQARIKNLYLIAHSMGNRALASAFETLVAAQPGQRSSIREVILAAPDIDADVFRNQVIPALVGTPSSKTYVTLYASSRDRALELSKNFHGYARAGDSANMLLAAGLESIDASAVDTSLVGHSYYADNRSVLSDIFYLVRDHVRACNRFGLVPQPGTVGTYCIVRP
jgi:esterase/lipase superfamily enzyme